MKEKWFKVPAVMKNEDSRVKVPKHFDKVESFSGNIVQGSYVVKMKASEEVLRIISGDKESRMLDKESAENLLCSSENLSDNFDISQIQDF